MNLNDWQRAFEAYLLSDDPHTAVEFERRFKGSPNLSAVTGLQIYHHAYRERLQEVLAIDYPVTRQWLGDDAFSDLAADYLRACPSSHHSLRWLGAGLESFVAHRPVVKNLPLAELIRLEWAFTLAFDAEPGLPLSLPAMAGLSADEWPILQVGLLPTVQWLDCRYNSLELWRAAKDGRPLPQSRMLASEVACLVWRADLNCYYRSLSAAEATALRGMTRDGWTFSDLCLQLTETFADNASLQAATWLKQWVTDSLLGRK